MLMQDLKDVFNQFVITEIEYDNSRGVVLIHSDNSDDFLI